MSALKSVSLLTRNRHAETFLSNLPTHLGEMLIFLHIPIFFPLPLYLLNYQQERLARSLARLHMIILSIQSCSSSSPDWSVHRLCFSPCLLYRLCFCTKVLYSPTYRSSHVPYRSCHSQIVQKREPELMPQECHL